jgi:hypothetical protein
MHPLPVFRGWNRSILQSADGHVPPPGQEAFRADYARVDGGFFEAAGVAIAQGRTFNDADTRDSRPVAVISQAMARRFWPDGDALGRRGPQPRSGAG